MSNDLVDLQRKIANLQRRLRRAGKRQKAREDKVDNQSLVLFIFSGHRADVAARFHLSMSDCFSSLDSAVAHVEWCYIKAPLEHKVQIMLDPSNQLPRSAVLPPFKFLLLFQLREWVQKMNHDFGVAPSRRMLCERLHELMPENLPAELNARLLRPLATARSQRKYFNAFRKRFGCKLGRLRSSPPMPLQEKQSKVGMGHDETFRIFCFVKGNPPQHRVRRNTSQTSNNNNVLGSDCEAAMFWLFSCLVGHLNLSDWWGIACSFLFWWKNQIMCCNFGLQAATVLGSKKWTPKWRPPNPK